MTFDSGSDEVKSEALASLTALADILKSGAATAYDVVVVGHTDARRIAANTASCHPTNLHLSAHRAISVIGVLGQMGVSESRLQAAGWGDCAAPPLRTTAPTARRSRTAASKSS